MRFPTQAKLVPAIALLAAWPLRLWAQPGAGEYFTGVVTAFNAARHAVTLTAWDCGRPQSLSAVFYQHPQDLRQRPYYWQVAIIHGHYEVINFGYQARLRDAIKLGYLFRAHYRPILLNSQPAIGIDQLRFLDPRKGRKSLTAELQSASRDGALRFIRKKNRRVWNSRLYPGFYVVFANGQRGPLPINFLHRYRVYRVFYRDETCGQPAKKIHWVIDLQPSKEKPWLSPPRPKLNARPPE